MRAIFEQITAEIIIAIEQGADDFVMPWHQSGTELPSNALTGENYKGTNIVALWAVAAARQFRTNRWATYRQWSALGAQVGKGERSTTVIFWKTMHPAEPEEGNELGHGRFIARAAKVFNQDQVDDARPVEAVPPLDPATRIAWAQAFFDALPTTVHHGGDQAFFDPSTDTITLPEFGAFKSATGYYSVRAHETVHWTAPKHRLGRDLSSRFGSAAYSAEELIAELGASFLSAHLQIGTEPRRDHAPYIASWLKTLRADPRAIVTAASQAQTAVDYLLSLVPQPAMTMVPGVVEREAA